MMSRYQTNRRDVSIQNRQLEEGVARETMMRRLGAWALAHLSQEHHCAPPRDGREWLEVRAHDRCCPPEAILEAIYVCPECDMPWRAQLVS